LILAGLFRPYNNLNQWLMMHWPRFWAEQYHFILLAGVMLSLLATLR
jgi:hypothetical protein